MNPPNPFLDNNDTPTLTRVCDTIDKVVKSPSIKNGETGMYHIFISGVDISLSSAQLTQGYGRFKTLYFDVFGKFLYIQKEEWPIFVEYLASISEIGEYEETAAIMAADLLFEELCNTFEISKEKDDLLLREGCNAFVEHSPHGEHCYVVPSGAVTSMLSEIRIKATIEDVSAAMQARGYTVGNTRGVKVRGQNIWCWWFNPAAIKATNSEIGVMCNV